MKFNPKDNIPVTVQWNHNQVVGHAEVNEDGSISMTITDPAIIDILGWSDHFVGLSVDLIEKTARVVSEDHIIRGEE